MSGIPEIWKHQIETKQFISHRGAEPIYDASDPGTGKTRAHLEAFADRRRNGGGRLLVVAPGVIMEPEWGGQADIYTPDLIVAHAHSGARREAFETGADIVTLNHDGIKWFGQTPRSVLLLREFDSLLIDEITAFKHATSARSRAMRKIATRFTYRTGFTGTPRSNSVLDLWHQIRILDGGKRLGKAFSAFREQLCIPKFNGFANTWVDRANANQIVMNLIQDMTIRHKFSEVMDVPPNHERLITFKLPDALREKYLEMEEHALIELQSGQVSAVNAASMRTKLFQMCSGGVYKDDKSYEILDETRYKLVVRAAARKIHSVVFFNWRHQRDAMIKEAKMLGVSYEFIDGSVSRAKRTKIVTGYQAGDYKILFLNPETGAHGLTLTRGTTTFWASPQYKPDVDLQGLHRIYRGGQTKETETIRVIAEDTVEQQVLERFTGKHTRMLNLMDLIAETHKLRRQHGQQQTNNSQD